MSFMSSYDISIEDHDDQYIKKLNELETGSGSGSGSDSGNDDEIRCKKMLFKTKTEENELHLLCLYLKCKRNVFNLASRDNRIYATVITLSTFTLTSSLIVLPFLTNNNPYVSSSVSIILMTLICLSKMCNFDINHHQYKMISNKYANLHVNVETFLAKFVYMSDKQVVFYNKTREIENRLYNFKEDDDSIKIPYSIRKIVPVISTIDIFQSIHNVEIEQNTLILRYKTVQSEIERIDDNNRIKQLTDKKKKIRDQLKSTNYSSIKQQLETEYKEYLIQYD